MLTGNLTEFGAGTGDPLEFLFDVTGGDAAALMGPAVGVVLSFSGFGGNLLSDFSTSFTSVADTFSVPTAVPAPAALTLLVIGLVGILLQRRV